MKAAEAYKWLLGHSREVAYLDSIKALLGWDQRTYIPQKGHTHRAKQFELLAKLIHSRMADPVVGERLADIEASNIVGNPFSPEAVNAREWRRAHDRATRIPGRLAMELAKTTSDAESVWEEARPANDWGRFKPHLERVIALKREEATALSSTGEPYDALLDEYEPGQTARDLDPIFSYLRDKLRDLLERLRGSSRRPNPCILNFHCPVPIQQEFAMQVAVKLGYDPEAGRIDPTAHPFCTDIGPGDVRITTRYEEHSFIMSLFSTIHEAGHAMYSQGLPEEHWGTPMGQTISLGVHESQSRLWENLVGRSLGFWKHFYPMAKIKFPELEDVSLESLYLTVNQVEPSLIRTEADEVTYNLHVLLRFELELSLIRGELQVADLPEAWNEKMRSILGISVPDYRDGVMQDVHWPGGSFGYFPTYTLGNLYSAQLFTAADREIGNLDELFTRGEFQPLLQWLRRKIHSQGGRYWPRDLIRFATGEDLNPRYLIDYLENKFNMLYH